MTVRAVSNNPTSPFYNANAPNLTGQVGSLTALLDAVLVNGFTGFTNLGWSINQTTTNKRGYKQNLTGSNNTSGMLLYVDDTGPGAGGAKEARVCGFETMSAITPTGTGQFPTSAQSTIGSGQLAVRKSTTADSTVRYWTLVGNGQTIYLFIESGDSTVPLATTAFVFGDFKSFKSSDQYAVIIIGRQAENSGSSLNDPLHCLNYPGANNAIPTLGTTMFGHYVARHWTGTGGSIRVGKPCDMSRAHAAVLNSYYGSYTSESQTQVTNGGVYLAMGRNASPYNWPAPNGPDGALGLTPVWIGHSYGLRGYLAGLWHPLHDRPCGHNDSFTVSGGNLNGKSLLAQNIQAYILASANADNGQTLVETSDTWT